MPTQGSPHARFKRALANRNALLAWDAAAELPTVPLADALELCLLVADDPRRYARAAARWHVRFCADLPGLTLAEAQLALAALVAIPDSRAAPAAAEALAHICERRGRDDLVRVLDAWSDR